MPLFEYRCRDCEKRFEEFVLGSANVTCRRCGSPEVQKLLSAFAVGNAHGRKTSPGDGVSCGSCGDPRGPGACSSNS